MIRKIAFSIILLNLCHLANAQFLMDMIDTTTTTGKGILSVYKKYDHLRFSGYIQPQFQVAEAKGARAFEGGDFATRVSNRFMLRRSRVRIDYVRFGEQTKPGVQIVFQFDANERGFTVRDVWGRIFENRYKLFSLTTGMFARPFGFEVNYSSSDRESPERGRMSQLLMKSERDLGVMASFDVRREKHPLKFLKIDAGLFNGQGINANGEFDNTKDIISRIAIKPHKIGKDVIISAGVSLLYGGLENNTKYYYTTGLKDGINQVLVDSTLSNEGKISPRRYYGGDLQVKLANRIGFTELRGEIVAGKQPGMLASTETPVSLLTGMNGFHNRNFKGAYIYFLQHLFSTRHHLLLKYDVYDPNTDVAGRKIGAADSNFTLADIKYNTLGFGYINYLSDNIKLVLYYAKVRNEKTLLPGYTNDTKDDIFTFRLQFRF